MLEGLCRADFAVVNRLYLRGYKLNWSHFPQFIPSLGQRLRACYRSRCAAQRAAPGRENPAQEATRRHQFPGSRRTCPTRKGKSGGACPVHVLTLRRLPRLRAGVRGRAASPTFRSTASMRPRKGHYEQIRPRIISPQVSSVRSSSRGARRSEFCISIHFGPATRNFSAASHGGSDARAAFRKAGCHTGCGGVRDRPCPYYNRSDEGGAASRSVRLPKR